MAILDGKLDVTTQEGYDVACALRGPDLPRLEHLKFLLVGRLRGLIGIGYKPGCLVATQLPSTGMVRKAQTDWNDFRHWMGATESCGRGCVGRALGHWAAHLSAAFGVLRVVHPCDEVSLLYVIAVALNGDGDSVIGSLEAYADYIKEQQ